MKIFWFLSAAALSGVFGKTTIVDPQVTATLQASQGATQDVFVMFTPYDFESNAAKFDYISGADHVTKDMGFLLRKVRRQFVRDELHSYMTESQKEIIDQLDKQGVQHESFWINNSLFIKNASIDMVESIASKNIAESIVLNEIVADIIQPVASDYFPQEDKSQVLWNLQQIDATKAWELTKGEGVTIANIDTGVVYNHEALIGNYRGNPVDGNGQVTHDFNWGDPQKTSPFPNDKNGHGTHTMGTILGKTDTQVIGVAPGAKWIAARGCASSGCSQYDLTWSGQWVVCPKSVDHTTENCELGADVSSNSWGGGRGNSWYGPVVESWLKAGIIPVFAQGNSGDRCGTANSPGDMASVIGVASTNKANTLSRFSSRGPGLNRSNFPTQKPDISAPGEAIYSSMNNGRYATLSGTSMACPHVAGLAGLLISANPNLSYVEYYKAIIGTADQKVLGAPTGQTSCGGVDYKTFPNFHYGHGRINAFNAVKAVTTDSLVGPLENETVLLK